MHTKYYSIFNIYMKINFYKTIANKLSYAINTFIKIITFRLKPILAKLKPIYSSTFLNERIVKLFYCIKIGVQIIKNASYQLYIGNYLGRYRRLLRYNPHRKNFKADLISVFRYNNFESVVHLPFSE